MVTNSRKIFWAAAFGMAAFFAGCSDKAPSVDMNLVNAFVDLRLIENQYGSSSPAARLARRDALAKYGYTQETFTAASDKVLGDDELWVPFQKAVVDRIDSLMAAGDKK